MEMYKFIYLPCKDMKTWVFLAWKLLIYIIIKIKDKYSEREIMRSICVILFITALLNSVADAEGKTEVEFRGGDQVQVGIG